MGERSKLKTSKVPVGRGKKSQTIVLLHRVSCPKKADWKKMTGRFNHLSTLKTTAVPTSPSLITIPSLCFKAKLAFLLSFGCCCCCCVFHQGCREAEGGPYPYRPEVIDAYNTTFMDSRLFQLPSWKPLFCVPALSATSRCPLRDVAIETQRRHKIVEFFSII